MIEALHDAYDHLRATLDDLVISSGVALSAMPEIAARHRPERLAQARDQLGRAEREWHAAHRQVDDLLQARGIA